MKNETRAGEFFRHLRPRWYDFGRCEIKTDPHGGISYLLVPIAERCYDFWISACPPTTQFSARQAVAALRRARLTAAPFGQIELDGRPILEQLVTLTAQLAPPPSTLGQLAKRFYATHERAEQAGRWSTSSGERSQYEHLAS